MARTVDVALELYAIFIGFTDVAETKGLKTTAIGEEASLISRKTVQTTKLLDHFITRAQVEMVGVCEDYLSIEKRDEIDGIEGFDTRRRTYGHKDGRFYGRMRCFDGSRTCVVACGIKNELQRESFVRSCVHTDVLILADGIVAKHFIERIMANYVSQNHYHVVYMDESLKPSEVRANFFFYRFDPTSFVKLSKLFLRRYKEVVIVLGNRIDTVATFENVRRLDTSVTIVVLDKWGLEIEDSNFIALDANEILANRIVDHLPNVPVIAQNVGLGMGEIMEVLVPFGSAYVYRHVGSIEQKNWKIAAIYRNNKLILPAPDTMIWPNDLLLLIGQPTVLREVFRSIKREVGQFPLPFGVNCYLFIDMMRLGAQAIRHLVMTAIYLHQKINDKKLLIRVVNPTDIATLDFIKSYASDDIDVMIDYSYDANLEVVRSDLQQGGVGLCIVHQCCFSMPRLREMLYEFKIPIFCAANVSVNTLKNAGLIMVNDENYEKISSVVFDVAVQLHLSLKLFEYDEVDAKILEHFQNLANIFSKELHIQKTKSNPIRYIAQREKDMLLVYPFSQKVLRARPWKIFSTDPEMLFFKLRSFHQIFIPVS